MSETVGDFLVKRLSEWGVRRISGYPGDGISGILAALNRAGNEPEFVQVRHEETASLMACAHAKFIVRGPRRRSFRGRGVPHAAPSSSSGSSRWSCSQTASG
nr:thiamine pyrophosphate-binding protein [Actinomycetota bacterium]